MALHRTTQSELDRMSQAEKDALMLFGGFGDLQRRVEGLEGQRKKTSHNLSKPPSSDGLKKGPAQPRKSGQHPNGGHSGQTRRMADQADTVVDLNPHAHCACGQALAGLPGTLKERRQQWDIPPPQILITEYRQHQVECTCAQVYCGEFHAGITPNVSFDPRIKAYAVGLIDGYFVGLQRTAEILQDHYGVHPSQEGRSQRWIVQASERQMDGYTAAGSMIQAAEVGHFEKSGMRMAGRLHWQHVAASKTAVHDSTHENHRQEAKEVTGILPRFQGCAVHEHWKPYLAYKGLSNALCNAHHLREMRYFEEITEHWWLIALRRLQVEGKEAVAAGQADEREAVDLAQIETLLKRYDEYLACGLVAFPLVSPDPHHKRGHKKYSATNLLVRSVKGNLKLSFGLRVVGAAKWAYVQSGRPVSSMGRNPLASSVGRLRPE